MSVSMNYDAGACVVTVLMCGDWRREEREVRWSSDVCKRVSQPLKTTRSGGLWTTLIVRDAHVSPTSSRYCSSASSP